MSWTLGAPSTEQLVIPEFWCPYKAVEHPRSLAFGAGALAWLEQFGFRADRAESARLAGLEMGRLIGYTAPRALDDVAELAVLLNMLYHVLDDMVGDAGGDRPLDAQVSLVLQLNHALTAPWQARTSSEPFVAALADIASKIAAFATREQYLEWAAGVQSYLLHEIGEAIWRERRQAPGLYDYAVYCIEGRAAMPSMMLLPILGGYQVDDAAATELRRLIRLACLIACLDNDIYSVAKEADQVGHVSLPLLIASERRIDLQSALEQARAVRDQVMLEFCAEHQRASTLSPAGRRLADDVAAWVPGQVAWALWASSRFAHPGAVLPRIWAKAPCTAQPLARSAAGVLLEAVGPRSEHR